MPLPVGGARRSGSPESQGGPARPVHERLLDAACEVFAERGYRGASVDELASRAGSTKPTLYAHFGDK
ncbi:TetR/AcrR family transcriptional regulator [Sciscionella marina]|uniref:TetR/AcrR family transcriptional regulator n=1 Tax=Sciscionella marina TaxID=508770 RepID=UPI001969D800|nr:helix-turn-helix domain-containing protein [Sciscionella marina]